MRIEKCRIGVRRSAFPGVVLNDWCAIVGLTGICPGIDCRTVFCRVVAMNLRSFPDGTFACDFDG